MRVIVTGIAGFIGPHVAESLVKAGHEVWGIDSMTGGEESNVPPSVAWLKGKCEDVQTLPSADVLIHCACIAREGQSVFSPKLVTNSVYGASVAMFSAAIAAGVKRIVFLSSMSRYGVGMPPFTEDQECRPVDPYGIAKVAAEQTLRCLAETHGVEYSIAVPHNVFGPRQCRWDPYRNVLAIWMNRILQDKPPIIYGDGLQRRSFSYIDDVVPCIVKMATGPIASGEVINIGPDDETMTVRQACAAVCQEMGAYYLPRFYPSRPREVKKAFCSSDKARQLLGYHTQTTFHEGVARMATWIKSVGPREFDYQQALEIVNDKAPKTWTHKEI